MRLGTQPRQRLTLVVACTAQVMMVLDVMIVSVALPSLQRELHLSPAGLEWVVSAYALTLAALIPTGGALGDHFGRKRVFMSGVALFMLASVGCALSVSGGMLIGFRVIQGIGGAVMSSLTLSLITEAYPPEARTGPIGLWAAVSGLAVAGGSVIGGLLLSVFPWSSIFWVNVPIAVVTLVISWFAVVESREPVPRPFDTAGVALSASGLLFLTFGFGDDHLAISIEARKEREEGYSSLGGFFRQYELIYVVGDERDLIRLRTNYRKDPPEDVYLFQVRAPTENGRRVFLQYMRRSMTSRRTRSSTTP